MTRIRARGLRGAAASLAALSLIVAACGGSDDSSDDASDDASTEETASDDSASSDSDSVEVTQDGGILAAVQARGTLNCGVSGAAVAFSTPRPIAQWRFDADYCRSSRSGAGDAEAASSPH